MLIRVLDEDLYAVELESGFDPSKSGDAGIDLRCTRDLRIEPFDSATIPLGVAVELPVKSVGWMTGRSSLTTAFGCISTEGKIDSGYRGEVHHFVHALNRPVEINRGERICQLVVLRTIRPLGCWKIAETLSESDRGSRKFGSSGRD